ncbi:MAG: DUF4184 family protein [Aequorivita sp.]
MPFTFSHPAIILPLTFLPRQWFSLTGLVIGSLAPDFEYFIRMRIQSDYSHTISGLFWFDLPLGIILAFIFHNIVRDSFFNNLPTILKSRLAKFKSFEWNEYFKKNWLVVIISVLIGAASHIFWDSFTHHNGYFVKTIPTLTNTVAFIGMQVPIYKILQHSSTIIGGLIVVFALYKITPDKNVTGKLNTTYWGVFSMLTLTIVAIRLISGLDFKLYGHLLATVISAGLISLTLTPILTRQRE